MGRVQAGALTIMTESWLTLVVVQPRPAVVGNVPSLQRTLLKPS